MHQSGKLGFMRIGGLLLLCLGLGCGGATSTSTATSSEVLNLSDQSTGQTKSATRGQEIDILLHTIGPGNYGDPEISSGSVAFVEMSYPPGQNPGGPTQLYRFQAKDTGVATIRITRTGTQPTASSAPFEVTIDVR
jgi:hypothetical protein